MPFENLSSFWLMPKTHSFERVYYTTLQAGESLHSMQLALHVLQRAIPPRESCGTATHLLHYARKMWHCHASAASHAKVVALPRIPREEGAKRALHQRVVVVVQYPVDILEKRGVVAFGPLGVDVGAEALHPEQRMRFDEPRSLVRDRSHGLVAFGKR